MMPDKQGLALLVNMHTTRSTIILLGDNQHAHLSANNQQVEGKMALALFELGYLELADPRTYMLSERGRQLAEHPAPRVETGARWALTSEAGRKIHFWREYMVAGKYPEYEAGCGLVRLLIWKKEQTTGYYCPDCMRSSSLTLLPGIQNEP
jgi:hypothetical protein